MKDDQRNYIAVGGFVLAMVVALLLWLAVLSGRTGTRESYYIVYESVMGLSPGLHILYQGHPVGLIDGLTLIDDDGVPRYRVDVSVDSEIRIPADSRAAITAPGLLSAVVIDIRAGASSQILTPGSEISGLEAANVVDVMTHVAGDVTRLVDEQIAPLLESFGQDVPEIMRSVRGVVANLEQSVGHIDEILNSENAGRVQRILVNLDEVTASAREVAQDLRKAGDRVESLSASAQELVEENRADIGHAAADSMCRAIGASQMCTYGQLEQARARGDTDEGRDGRTDH